MSSLGLNLNFIKRKIRLKLKMSLFFKSFIYSLANSFAFVWTDLIRAFINLVHLFLNFPKELQIPINICEYIKNIKSYKVLLNTIS